MYVWSAQTLSLKLQWPCMTTILSLLCSDPLAACHSGVRRDTPSPEQDYLLDSDSWDLCGESTSVQTSTHFPSGVECPDGYTGATADWPRCTSREELLARKYRTPRLKRIMVRCITWICYVLYEHVCRYFFCSIWSAMP